MWNGLAKYKAAALGFAVAAAYWPGMIAGAFMPRWAVIALGVPLVSKLDPRNLTDTMKFVLVFFVALGAVSLLGSPYPLAGVQDLLFIVFLCGAFLLGAEQDSLDAIMVGISAGLAVSTIMVIGQYFGLLALPHDSTLPAGLFFNSELLGEFAALVFVWGALKHNWLVAISAGLPVFLTQSRVGAIAIIIGLFYARRPRSIWLNLAIIMGVILIAGAMLAGFGFDVSKMQSAMHRITLWGAAILAWTPFGNGLGWGTAAFPYEQFVHSDAIQAATELGIGAIVALAIPFVAFRNNRGSHAERALFVACCVEIAISFPLHFPATGFVAAVVAGYLVSARPVVWLGRDVSGIENGFRYQRWNAASAEITGGSGRRRGALSVRPVPTLVAPLHPRAIGAYSKTTGT
jgi:hypothetical protein